MTPMALLLDDRVRPGHAGNDGLPVSAPPVTPLPPTDAPTADARPAATHGLAARIRLLIQTVGSASELARRCGFSEGAVRSWRDGHSDISRERCVTIARTLGVSLPWLVCGEGTMRPDPPPHARAASIDPQRLAASLRLLQSYIGLIGGALEPGQRALAAAELYELLGRAGEAEHADRMLHFHAALRERVHQRHTALVA